MSVPLRTFGHLFWPSRQVGSICPSSPSPPLLQGQMCEKCAREMKRVRCLDGPSPGSHLHEGDVPGSLPEGLWSLCIQPPCRLFLLVTFPVLVPMPQAFFARTPVPDTRTTTNDLNLGESLTHYNKDMGTAVVIVC